MNESAGIIERLQLQRHPEGGWFREAYRSRDVIEPHSLPERYSSAHCFGTSIYFMLDKDDFSAFHRIQSDETWHFYLGSPILIHCIFPDGTYSAIEMGRNIHKGQVLQFTIPQNCWFAARNLDLNAFSLVGCTVAPGFEYPDFELAKKEDLMSSYPQYEALIREFTRQ